MRYLSEAPQAEREENLRSRAVGSNRSTLKVARRPECAQTYMGVGEATVDAVQRKQLLVLAYSLLLLIQITKKSRRGAILNPLPFF